MRLSFSDGVLPILRSCAEDFFHTEMEEYIMKKFWEFGMSAALAAILLAGCGGEEAAPAEETEAPAESGQTEEGGDSAFPVTLTDATGEEVVIEEEPAAIISMVPSNTEIVFELDLGEKVVGVSDFDNYPPEAAEIDKIGGQEFNIEQIISLEPDLVLGHESGLGMGAEGYQQLRDAGLTVFVVDDATSFEETYETISVIGQATGASGEAETIIEEMKAEVAEIEEQAAEVEEPKLVYVEVGSTPEIYTTGSGTFIDEILNLLNVENLAGDQEGWVSLDPEAIVAKDPDVILTTEAAYVPDAIELIKTRGGFADVQAVKDDAIYAVDSDKTTRPGPRLTEGLLEIAQAVYPEIFSE